MKRFLWLLPLALALLLYLPALPGAGWVLDDQPLLRDHVAPTSILGEWIQPTYAAAGGAPSYVWRPLIASCWRLLTLLFGASPWVFHAFNLGMHLLELLLLQRVVRRIGGSRDTAPLAAFLALVLTLHPSTPDLVGWAASAFDLAAGLCLLLALERGLAGGRMAPWLVAALLCKETALPGLVVVPMLVVWVTGKGSVKSWSTWVGPAVAAALWGGAHVLVTRQAGQTGPLADVARAWMQGLGLVAAPPRAALAHLYNPEDPWWGGALIALAGGICWLAPRFRPVSVATGVWAVMLLPVALGVPMIGLWPLRYLHLPLLLALVPVATAVVQKRWLFVVGTVLGLAWGPRVASRVDEWGGEAALWKGELAMEEGNPYALRQWVRLRWPEADLAERRELLPLWEQSIRSLPRPLAFFDPEEERFELAKGAFQVGEFALARAQGMLYLKLHPDRREAWCLLADAGERSDAPEEEVKAADAKCRP